MVVGASVKRVANRPNYAQINRRGFNSISTVKTKRLRPIKKARSVPSSPVNVVDKKVKVKKKQGLNVKKLLSALDELKKEECEVDDNNSLMNTPSHDCNVSLTIAEMAKGMMVEECKRQLQDSINRLEIQLKQQEEDQELQELIKKQEMLQRKLRQSSSSQVESFPQEDANARSARKKGQNKSSKINSPSSKNIGHKKSKHSSVRGQADDFNDVFGNEFPSLAQVHELLCFPDKRTKHKRAMKSKRRISSPRERSSSSESSAASMSESSMDNSEAESEWSDNATRTTRKGKRVVQSGMYAKVGHVKLVRNQTFAHAALDEEMCGDRDLKSLPFSLLVVGELEIISDPDTGRKERFSRIELLKKLCYKQEFLTREEIINEYIGFICKVEKGKFKWGSKADLKLFEQQLIFRISVERGRTSVKKDPKEVNKLSKLEGQKKYCLDFNRGTCTLVAPHEGKINGMVVVKHHICRRCLVNEGTEKSHAEKDCQSRK